MLAPSKGLDTRRQFSAVEARAASLHPRHQADGWSPQLQQWHAPAPSLRTGTRGVRPVSTPSLHVCPHCGASDCTVISPRVNDLCYYLKY
eukprot:SAG31_NODE_2811_length_5052_cov_3.554613_1_plen_90_part_00